MVALPLCHEQGVIIMKTSDFLNTNQGLNNALRQAMAKSKAETWNTYRDQAMIPFGMEKPLAHLTFG